MFVHVSLLFCCLFFMRETRKLFETFANFQGIEFWTNRSSFWSVSLVRIFYISANYLFFNFKVSNLSYSALKICFRLSKKFWKFRNSIKETHRNAAMGIVEKNISVLGSNWSWSQLIRWEKASIKFEENSLKKRREVIKLYFCPIMR